MTNDEQHETGKLFLDSQALLRSLLDARLQTLPLPLRSDVVSALKEKGSLLSAPSSSHEQQQDLTPFPVGVWALLTLLVARQLAPNVDLGYAGSVAVAVECTVQAFDVLDDIQDDDRTTILLELGRDRCKQVSTALLMLACQELLSLEQQGIDARQIILLLQTMQEAIMEASAGQQRDLLAEARAAQDLTREECLEIAAAKAGTLMRLAFRLGAQCAGACAPEVDFISEQGMLLGIAAQLDNDCLDLYDLLRDMPTDKVTLGIAEQKGVRSDVRRGKKTLPVVLAARAMHAEQGGTDPQPVQELPKWILLEKILATSGIAHNYYERMREAMQEFERDHGPLLPALRALLFRTPIA